MPVGSDPGGLLHDLPSFLRVTHHEVPDVPLPDEGVQVLPDPRVTKHVLNVLQTGLVPVQKVSTLPVTPHLPGD